MAIQQEFYIDGFRSLREFNVTISSGLNLLCGPNGSGKTNFLAFLGFISDAVISGASNAISRVGGVSKAFSVENIKKNSPTIIFRTTGIADLNNRIRSKNDEFQCKYFKYEYSIEIVFNRQASVIYISKENLRLYRRSNLIHDVFYAQSVGQISLKRFGPGRQFDKKFNLSPGLLRPHSSNPLEARSRVRRNRPIEEILDQLAIAELEPDESFLGLRGNIPALDSVRKSITRGLTYNIIPDRARIPNDVTHPPYIDKDGFGLSSVLYYLNEAERGSVSNKYYMGDIPEYGFDMMKQWARLIYPELQDISILRDIHTGKFLVYINVGTDIKSSVRVPLQSLSDGTIKWLSYISLIAASKEPSSIEEPENFLHPKVQSLFVDLVRESSSESALRFYILSSHSETIINACRPEEITIFEFVNNRTVCRKISNVEKVREEINRTGFGLGYYYASGALS